jgi:hypothetical protein
MASTTRFCVMVALHLAACSSSVSESATPNGSTGGSDSTLGGGSGGDSLTQSGGPVSLSGVFNARQPGGLPAADGRRVRNNLLIRTGDLHDLDATGCTQLDALNVHTVIDLRDATDRSARPDVACATTGRNYQPLELPKLLPPSSENYLATLVAAEPKLASIFGVLAVNDGLPAILHCVIGRDRASLITALVLLAVGAAESAVLADMVGNQDASIQMDRAWMDGVFARLHAQATVDAYLAVHGVPGDALAQLRSSMLE